MMLYQGKDENYFLLMVQPPKQVGKENIPPREYIFIMDVSGSMRGFPLDVSKKLMRNLILSLKPTDKFNVVLFSGASAVMSRTSIDATQANIEKAVCFIDAQQGGGGTEVMDALRMAYALPRTDPDVSRTFVIATDGYVSVEREAFEQIRKNSGDTNFFSFGIGSSVNRYLIEGMAFAGNGEPMIVTKDEDAEQQAEKFRNYINTPVLTRIKMNSGTFQTYDVEPSAVPDMMAERPILIYGKYKGEPTGTVTLTGKIGHKTYSQSFDLSQLRPQDNYSALRYLWARERIKYLDYLVKSDNGRGDSTTIKEITRLGLKYNLMTNYTSFVAVDERIVNKDGKMITVQQPIPLPQGVPDSAVGEENEMNAVTRGAIGCYSARGNECAEKYKVQSYINTPHEEEGSKVFDVVEQMPSFPSGNAKLTEYLKMNIRYPKSAQENGIQGRVIVSFVVEKDGSISHVKVTRSVDPALDAEAVRIVKRMPKWIPGKRNGKNVAVKYSVPISFHL